MRAAVTGVGVASVLALGGYLVRTGFPPMVRLDNRVTDAATGFTLARPWLRRLLMFWQAASQPTPWHIVATLVCGGVAWRHHWLRTRALWCWLTLTASWLLVGTIKALVGRARPVVQDALTHVGGYSYPSGHAANDAAIATALILLCWPLLHRSARPVVVTAGVVFVLITGLDRIFLGVHYLSDVLAGFVFGVGLVSASYAGYSRWHPVRHTGAHGPHPGDELQPPLPDRRDTA